MLIYVYLMVFRQNVLHTVKVGDNVQLEIIDHKLKLNIKNCINDGILNLTLRAAGKFSK